MEMDGFLSRAHARGTVCVYANSGPVYRREVDVNVFCYPRRGKTHIATRPRLARARVPLSNVKRETKVAATYLFGAVNRALLTGAINTLLFATVRAVLTQRAPAEGPVVSFCSASLVDRQETS